MQYRGIDIKGLTADSREVKPGFLFAALAGSHLDGARFIDDALARGAAAILAAPGVQAPQAAVPFLSDPEPRRRLAKMAATFYGRQPKIVAAVTGTSGKTSVVSFMRQIWGRLGQHAASLGTLGLEGDGLDGEIAHTTPDPVVLHMRLKTIADQGITHLAMEASSHGIDQCRLDGVDLAAGVFTNLGHDHLDYHRDADDYFGAKQRLFAELLPAGAVAVLNTDDARYDALAATARGRGLTLVSFGQRADFAYEIRERTRTAQRLLISEGSQKADIWLPLAADFQAANAVTAYAAVRALGGDRDAALAALENLAGVRGRLEAVAERDNGACIYVDYAHKPEALEQALLALRPYAPGRLIVVFGCGGDRDRAKRPLMGEIACRMADLAIVTDDNPRSESAVQIRRDILAGAGDAREIGDRGEAIREACALLQTGDVLLIAGKGHEQGQEIAGVKRPFDDAGEVLKALLEIEGGG